LNDNKKAVEVERKKKKTENEIIWERKLWWECAEREEKCKI
jgi:hypothetical protein